MANAKTEATIIIDGEFVSFSDQQILSITISKEVNKVASARLILKDGLVDKQDFHISNKELFRPGKPIEILLGTPNEKFSVFKGIVIKHGIKAKHKCTSILHVECKDEAIKLSIGRKSRFWNDKSDSDIFKDIMEDYPTISIKAEDSQSITIHDQMVQYYATDWDFMAMRAEAIGQYLFVDDGTIKIEQPKLSKTPKLTLIYGAAADTQNSSRIWDFESEMEARYQFDSINTIAWDYSKQEVRIGNNSFSSNNEAGDIKSDDLTSVIGLKAFDLHHHARMDEKELNAFADAVKQKSVLNKNRGVVKIDGRWEVKPGDMVALSGIGNRFQGAVFVSRIQHTFEPGRWFTHIKFGLPYAWFHQEKNIANPPVQGLLPPISGLQIGKVIQLKDEKSPDKDFRLKVAIAGLHIKNEGVWARYISFQAGNNRGAIFLPDIGDEVVLGYIGQDSREPVIIGSLYSEANAMPLQNTDDNFLKGIITKNGHKITIDEKDDILTIETPGKNKVLLDDKAGKLVLSDKNNNSITLDSSGINLKSGSNISLEAPKGTINIKGNMVAVVGKTGVGINNPQGGLIKLGNGILPAASSTDLVIGPLAALAIAPTTKNTKVLI